VGLTVGSALFEDISAVSASENVLRHG
jgi:hypothetical protein